MLRITTFLSKLSLFTTYFGYYLVFFWFSPLTYIIFKWIVLWVKFLLIQVFFARNFRKRDFEKLKGGKILSAIAKKRDANAFWDTVVKLWVLTRFHCYLLILIRKWHKVASSSVLCSHNKCICDLVHKTNFPKKDPKM